MKLKLFFKFLIQIYLSILLYGTYNGFFSLPINVIFQTKCTPFIEGVHYACYGGHRSGNTYNQTPSYNGT